MPNQEAPQDSKWQAVLLSWLVKGASLKKRNYAILLVTEQNKKLLDAKIESLEEYNPGDYGYVIYKGTQKPTPERLAKIEKKLGVSLIGLLDE